MGKSFAFQHFERVICHDLPGFRLYQQLATIEVLDSNEGSDFVLIDAHSNKKMCDILEFEATQCLMKRQCLAHKQVYILALKYTMLFRLQNHHYDL